MRIILIYILISNGLFSCVYAQTITTIAGDGSFGVFSGDGGPATMAGIHLSDGLLVDSVGNVYISTQGRVRKVDAAGIINTFAGGGLGPDGSPATAASLGTTLGSATDSYGNFFVVANNRVRKINSAGIISTTAGTGIGAYTGDGGPATAADLFAPSHITFNTTGDLYIAHPFHIRMVNSAGIITTIAGINLPGYSGDGGPAIAAQFNVSGGIITDNTGNIYFADRQNNVIRKITPAGIISTFAGTGFGGFGGDGGLATAANFHEIADIAFDPWGNMYLCDAQNNRIRRIDPTGIVTTIAGTGTMGFSGDGGPASLAELFNPRHISIDPQGNIFFNDRHNHRIRRISTFNRAPYFTKGIITNLTACGEYNPVDTLLRVIDSNANQSITWSLLSPPAHGTAVVAYTATSTGGVLTPVGTGYTPTAGYEGPDTFRVRVTDGPTSDTITIAVDVQIHPTATPITGADTICVGDAATLSGPTVGGGTGTWSSPHSTVTVGAGTGVVTGMAIGTAVVTYTLTNYCGTATATHTVTVLAAIDCPTGVGNVAFTNSISISPNPNTGNFTLLLPQHTESHITITDMMGRKVKELTATASCTCALPPQYGAGVYVVAVEAGGERWHGKVVVR